MSLSMTLYKVLCDDHVGCICIGQDHTSMSSWVLDHERSNKKVCTITKELKIDKNYLRSMWILLKWTMEIWYR